MPFSDFYQQRRQDIETNIAREQKLLKEYEEKLSYSGDPREIAKLKQDIERQKGEIGKYLEQHKDICTSISLNTKEISQKEQKKILILSEVNKCNEIHASAISSNLNLDLDEIKVILDQLEELMLVKLIKSLPTFDDSSCQYYARITSQGRFLLKGINISKISDNKNYIEITTTQNKELLQLLQKEVDRSINIEAKAMTESKSQGQIQQTGNFGIGYMSGGEIKGNAKIAGVINEAEQQNLSETASEIKQLLNQLSQTYPTSTSKEKMTVVAEAVDRIETNPTFKARVINTLKAGGTEAFKRLFLTNCSESLICSLEI